VFDRILQTLGQLAFVGERYIEAGWTPGLHFTPALARAFEYQLETGCTDIPTLLRAAEG